MKNVIKNSKKGILMVTMLATMLSFANEVSFTIKNDANRTSLTFYDVKEGNLLSIKDDNGIILYKELIEKQGTYTKGFDLTTLPDGIYVFELEKDMEIDTIPFSVKSSIVLFDKEKEKIIFKPFTRIKGNLVYLTQLALNNETFKVNIYSNSQLVYSEKIENTKDIKRVFKLVDLKKGNYKMVCQVNDRIFTKVIN